MFKLCKTTNINITGIKLGQISTDYRQVLEIWSEDTNTVGWLVMESLLSRVKVHVTTESSFTCIHVIKQTPKRNRLCDCQFMYVMGVLLLYD